MPEEIKTEQDTGQDQFTNDFFGADNNKEVLVDDDGNPLKTAKPEKTETKNNESATKTDSVKPDKQEKKNNTPTGFEQRFFTKDEKTGESAFEPQSAMDFFMPKKDSKLSFSYSPRKFEAPVIDPNAKKDDTLPWEKELEEERSYRDGLKSNLLQFKSKYTEYRNAGYDEATSAAAAERDLSQFMEEHLKEREYAQTAKKREEEYNNIQEIRKYAEFEQKSHTNEAVFANELGGRDKYEQLMFDKDLGGVIVQKLFDMQNPEVKAKSVEELQTEMSKWWTKFSADMSNLQFVHDFAQARLQKKIWPKLVDHIRVVKERQLTSAKEGATKADNGLKAALHGGKAEKDSFDDYMNRVPGAIPEI